VGAPRRASKHDVVDESSIRSAARALADLRRMVLQVRGARPPALRFSTELRARFLTWSEHDQHNSRQWLREQSANLTWWGAVLGDVDLRKLSLRDQVLPALEDDHGRPIPGRKARACVLKRFCSWLVDVRHELDDNPVAALHLPQSRPAQWRASKIVEARVLEATRDELSRYWRPALDVLCGTAWHVTELARFARAGALHPPTPHERRQRVAGVLETRHKGGAPQRTAVSAAVLRAARRLRGRGLSISRFCKALRAAELRAGVEPWGPGRLRHTVASFALSRGAHWQAVADFLQHADKRTTKRWYTLYVAPCKVPTPL
jgi:integrase